jgi:Protein of unknown function (DUF3108)
MPKLFGATTMINSMDALAAIGVQLRAKFGRCVLLAISMLGAAPLAYADSAPPVPGHVRADYAITFNGIELGHFIWNSTAKNGQYTLASDARLTALFGAYKWQGITRAAGSFSGGDVRPSAYGFKFEATDKNGQVEMRFAKGRITDLQTLPVDEGLGEKIPVQPSHLAGVLDPLSAVMAMSTPVGGKLNAGSPCQRRLAVFDGKQRFDLVLSFVRKEKVNAAGATTAFVCRIRYVPIAGHKNNGDTRYMTENTGIEIWLAPIDYANVYVPTNIVIPTWAGTAEISARSVQIDMSGNGVVASTN